MGGVPRNLATNRFAGSSYTSWGLPICCTTPSLHHHDHVGDAHGLFLIVGDENGGNARFRAGCGESPPGSAAAAARPDWTAARPAAAPAAFSPAPGQWPRAAAGRRKARWACGPSVRRSAPAEPPPGPDRSISSLWQLVRAASGSAAGKGCSAKPSCGDTGRSSGTPARRRAFPAEGSVTSSSPKKILPGGRLLQPA